jgi:sulfur carrier protein
MTKIRINGADEEIAASTVSELLAARGVDPAVRFVAVAVNGSVVRRSEWPSRVLAAGDDVEIVRPFSGG